MKATQVVLFAAVLGFGLTAGHVAQAKDKWVCMKDDAEVKVKGKKDKDKQKACEEKGGVWEKSHGDTQSSGGGGAW